MAFVPAGGQRNNRRIAVSRFGKLRSTSWRRPIRARLSATLRCFNSRLLFSHPRKRFALWLVLWYYYNKMIDEPRGPLASRLRQRKFELLRRFQIPDDALPGSLSLSHLRCGKSTCHCAEGRGHEVWSLTFMVQGKKHVQHIPKTWVAEVRRRTSATQVLGMCWTCFFPWTMKVSDQTSWPRPSAQWQVDLPQRRWEREREPGRASLGIWKRRSSSNLRCRSRDASGPRGSLIILL